MELIKKQEFMDKLRYMGYMDDNDEIEEVAKKYTINFPESEFYQKMKMLSENNYEEDFHIKADDLLCELLEELGYGMGIEVFRHTPKWYS